jgi:hypothetical protein
LRLQIIGFVEEHRINFFEIDEVLDVDSLSGFEIHSLKVLFLQHDVFALLVLITLDDLVPRNLLAIFFSNAFVINRAKIGFT